MNRTLIMASLFAICLPFSAHALDNSVAVKVTPLLKSSTSWDGKALAYPEGQAEVTALIVEIAAGAQTGWHEHPVASFAYVLEGTLEVTRKTGETKVLHVGDVLPEVVNTLHNGRSLDGKSVKLLVLYTGAVGRKLTVAHPELDAASTAAQ
ncbi:MULTISPECIES: cupin domain-containing protein [unclassified Janthinobacterium]|uniref:cupin domain-containing protein n=1 Tax=unclassified Janthinobacterium TaxID=2610881 RepID=UPI0006847801|nr:MULTISPECIES: cupin domain-containing protein [unclassified Janthinobacterium]MEC5164132.1 quercetin dioxygenase-like cupin family protein [Janthinobacterium sp. CG_S6]